MTARNAERPAKGGADHERGNDQEAGSLFIVGASGDTGKPVRVTGEVHPYADAFPMLANDDLQALADDIKVNGLREPIVLTPDGMLLDGRNRLNACTLVGVEPHFRVHEGEPVAFIVSANLHRRHLTTGQRAAGVALGLAAQDKRHGSRWVRGSVPDDTSDSGSKRWPKSMAEAGLVYDVDPALLHAVLNGATSLSAAFALAHNVRSQRVMTDVYTRTLRDQAGDLSRLVLDGKLTLDEAWSAYEKRTEAARREQEMREKQDLNRYSSTANAIYCLADITGPWMDDYDPERYDGHITKALTTDQLLAARDKLDDLIAWSKGGEVT